MEQSIANTGLPMQSPPTLLVVGCGDIGAAVAQYFARRDWRVVGVRRSVIDLPGVTMIAADVTEPASLTALQTIRPDYVLVVLTPGEFSDRRYREVYVDGTRNILNAIDTAATARVVWVSSTSVYHQNNGEWIDETSPATPQQFSGMRLLEAEHIVAHSGIAHTIVRFGGIYGPGRDRLLQQLRSGQRTPSEPVRYSNRIHRDDAVAILQFLLECAARTVELQSLYLGVDTEPAPMSDIERWFCSYLKTEYGECIDYASLAPTASGRGGSRCCSSACLQRLGYRFIYPTFREGLPTLIETEAQRV